MKKIVQLAVVLVLVSASIAAAAPTGAGPHSKVSSYFDDGNPAPPFCPPKVSAGGGTTTPCPE